MPTYHDSDTIIDILTTHTTVAVVGISTKPIKAGHYVPAYLRQVGFNVYGVSPVATEIFGDPVYKDLGALPGPVDMVIFFRRSALLPGHLAEVLAMRPRPAVVWLQLGIVNDDFAEALEAVGITVVQDRCTLADHKRLVV